MGNDMFKLATTEIQRWADMYRENSIVHAHDGQYAQSDLCVKMAHELNNVLKLLNAVDEIHEDSIENNESIDDSKTIKNGLDSL